MRYECSRRRKDRCPARLKIKLHEAGADQFELNSYNLCATFLYGEHTHEPEDDNSIMIVKYANMAKNMADKNTAGVILYKITQCMKDQNRSQDDITALTIKPNNMRKCVSRVRSKNQRRDRDTKI